MPSRKTQKTETGKAKTSKYMAFASYCHKDNDTDGKWITEAAKQLEKLVRREAGMEFPIFVDFLDTRIGRWKPEHEAVLDSVPFLIVFITPCFLKSRDCRTEVNKFSRGAGAIVPIFYVAVDPEPSEKRFHARLVKWQGEPWVGISDKCGPKSKQARPLLVALARRIKKELKSGRVVMSTRIVAREAADTSMVLGTLTAVRRPEEAKLQGRTSGLQFLGKNDQGFEEYYSPIDGAEMVGIPAGAFKMGSTENDNENPVHEVLLGNYCIDKYPVTNAQYRKFCDATGRDYPQDPGFSGMPDYFTKNPDYPIVNVSWEDARAYCEWAGKRFPTEAEWERAARGQDERKYPWGNAEPDGSQCNFADKRSGLSWADKKADDGFARTSPVKPYAAGASPYGVMDMAGNVWEWCNDWYAGDYYKRSPAENPKGPDSGSARVLRGGSWHSRSECLRCASRVGDDPSPRYDFVGFRCAVDV